MVDTVTVSIQGTPVVTRKNSDEAVASVQKSLLALGYTSVGDVDGLMGDKTVGSILNFRQRNRLPLTSPGDPMTPLGIDDQLIAALANAPKVFIPEEQAKATVAEVAPKVEAVQKTWWANTWAHILAWPTGIITILGLMIDSLGDAIEKLTPLKGFLGEYLSSVPPLTMILMGTTVVSVVSFFMVWQSGKAQRALIEGYQKGTVRNDNKLSEDAP